MIGSSIQSRRELMRADIAAVVAQRKSARVRRGPLVKEPPQRRTKAAQAAKRKPARDDSDKPGRQGVRVKRSLNKRGQ